jgi:hypothetical protein
MLPLIPLLALIGIGTGGAVLLWYECLSDDQKQEADAIAHRYANALYGKKLTALDAQQANRVRVLTQRHFEN